VAVGAQMAEIELQADQEHQQDQPDLAQDAEDQAHRRLKYLQKQARKEVAKKGRPQNDAGGNLPAYLRLAEVAKDHAEETSCRYDDDQLDDDNQKNVLDLRVDR